jgi:uncharacterized protein (TIGR02757 family)
VARGHHPTAGFPDHLRTLYAHFPFDRSLAQDPLSCVRPYAADPRSAEIAGLVAATLAIGNTTAIRGSFAEFARRAGDDLPAFVAGTTRTNWPRRLAGFRHRWIRGDQLAYLASQLNRVYASYESLEEVFLEGWSDGLGFAGGLDRMARELRGPATGPDARAPPGYRRLFPTPADRPGSPCKRMTLFVRWMTRPSYPDLGLWNHVPTGELRVPLDQHVHWIAYHMGLTQRRSRTWRTVEEVTESLRRIDPIDPIRFDFVLCHTGISGDCPKARDIAVCGPCSLRPDCLLWRGARAS